jgi:hypothetical protein
MKLMVQQALDATVTLTKIINENRPLSVKGAYLVARMHAMLKPEADRADAQRTEIIAAYGTKAKDVPGLTEAFVAGTSTINPDQWVVPQDKVDDFNAKWSQVATLDVEVPVSPIPLSALEGSGITALEFGTLGCVVED